MLSGSDWSFSTPTAGEPVSLDSALLNVAFGACRRVLVTEVSQLPIHTYRERDGRKTRISNPQIVASPSVQVLRRGWTSQVMDSLVRAGNAYLRATDVDMATGRLMRAEPINPTAVTWQAEDNVLRPYVNGVQQTLWPLGDFVHIPASAFLTSGSPVAMSPVELARESISTDQAANKYVAGFFANDGHPKKIIFSDQELKPAQAAEIKAKYAAATAGGAVPVFGRGLHLEEFQASPSDTEFLDLLQFDVVQACRVTGVPPSFVYASISGQNVTYSNANMGDIQFLKHGLSTWLGDLEDHITSWLAGPQFVKFNVDALLRVTPAERHDIYKTRLESQTITVDEIRELEDETPFGGEYAKPGTPVASPGESSDQIGATDDQEA